MRWQGQKLDDDAADPALLPMKGLVRSVRTPEFDGVTFHEVAAKSALNKVPAQSNMPFKWTINPMRGCLHQCRYCLSPDTWILMADGRQKALRDVRVGDRVVGTRQDGTYRYFVSSEVKVFWHTRKPAYRVTLNDGTQIIASGDHRFLTERGWKHVAPLPAAEGQRPALTTNNSLQGFGLRSLASEYVDHTGEGQHANAAAIARKLNVLGKAVKTSSDLGVASVEDLGYEMPMIDLSTETEDFIANGVVSHNCFARKTHEYLDLDSGKDFDTQIVVKTNISEVLRGELAKPSWKREHVALGTNTDPYQRSEGRYSLMPGIIRALADSGTPFSILTKGPLLKRDLPLLTEAAQQVPVSVAVSLAIMDPELQQKVEPGTPDPRARLNLIRSITDAGLECTVMAMPILPWLTDSEDHLDRLHAALAEVGASWVTTGALHLRPGAREWYMQWLKAEYPALVPKYRRLYRDRRGSFASYADKDYKQWLGQRAAAARRRHGFIDRPAPTWRARTAPEGNIDESGEDSPELPGLELAQPAGQPTLF